MLEVKNVSNITFFPSPVDIWRRLQRNVSFSSGGDAVFDTFIPLFVDENILGTSFSSEMPRLDSIEESSSTDNYDDVHSSQDADSDSTVGFQEIPVKRTHTKEKSSTLKENDDELNSSKIEDADSDSTVGSQEIQVTGTHTEEKSSALKENDDELNTSKVAGYPGVDVSEDVFYLLEK